MLYWKRQGWDDDNYPLPAFTFSYQGHLPTIISMFLKLGGASFVVVSDLWYLSLVTNYVDESSVLFLNN